jgi:small-conductance mechanosensitive channel
MPENIERFLAELESVIRQLQANSAKAADWAQGIALIIVGLISWALQFLLQKLVDTAEPYLPDEPWRETLVAIVRRLLLPVTLLLVMELTIDLFTYAGQNVLFLEGIERVILVWIVYRLLAAFIVSNLSSGNARFWKDKVLRPIFVIVGVLAAFGAVEDLLELGIYVSSVGWTITVGGVLFAVGIVLVFWLLARWARSSLKRTFLPQAGLEPGTINTVSKITAYIIVTIGVLIGLGAMGIDLTGLLVVLGGLSVGIAFGLQDVVNNFISGFIILFERSIEVGNIVEVSGNVGTVRKIGIRSTTITTRDNVELIVPNSRFLSEITTNLTHSEDLVRTHMEVGVSYNAAPREVEKILVAVAAQHPSVLADPPPRVQFREFGDSSLNFVLLVWTEQAIEILFLTSDLRFAIWDALAASGVEIPYPQRDLHIRSGVPWSDLAPSADDSLSQQESER